MIHRFVMNIINETGLKVIDFFHHCMTTMSAHIHVCIAIFCLKVEHKQVCEQSLQLYRKDIKQLFELK